MRVWEIKGYVVEPGKSNVRFSTVINALDRSSATTLVKSMYAAGPNQNVNISSITDKGSSSLKSN